MFYVLFQEKNSEILLAAVALKSDSWLAFPLKTLACSKHSNSGLGVSDKFNSGRCFQKFPF